MKHMYTSTFILRALTLILSLSLLLGIAALPVCAAEADTEEASTYMTWEYFHFTSSDVEQLNGYDPVTGATYKYGTVTVLSPRIRVMPGAYYTYANKVEVSDGVATLTAPSHGSDYLLLDGRILLATNEGKQALSKLAKQQVFNNYRLTRGENLYASIDRETLKAISSGIYGNNQKQEYSLFDLRDKTCYTVYGFNEDGWFGVPVAFVYELEDGLYYASAVALADDCFDSNGELKPKTGVKLSLYLLDEETSDMAYDVIRDINFHYPRYTYESGSSLVGGSTEDYTGAAFASVVVLGILLPIAPITLGLCFPHAKSMGRKKRWYLLAILGGAWLALGIFTLVMTILCV